MHDMFVMLEETEGTDGLRRFFDKVAVGTPELQARLKNNDLLRKIDLDLDAKMQNWRVIFPTSPEHLTRQLLLGMFPRVSRRLGRP